MIIETKNSAYEIQGNWIRKVGGKIKDTDLIGPDFLMFRELAFPPKVGERMLIMWEDATIRTSMVTAIVASASNDADIPAAPDSEE